MSLETEALRPSGIGAEKLDEALKKPRRSYTREFLLSLSDLDVCKKLPSGFDESLLSEFGDGAQSLHDRLRVPGSHHFQGLRRNDHGSSPPNRWDSSNFTAGSFGKSGSHSFVQSDRDSDSQSDRDSESGRHRWQSRRSWQATEHDGLLGSGSSSRLTGYSPGTSAPKIKANDNFPLKKSSEPYQPPRPYKAVPYSKRDAESNDETFGSSDCISEDRAEEERRRRASFEQIRKEQLKALQEKQTPKIEHNVDGVFDIFVQHDNKKGDVGSSINKDGVVAVDQTWKNLSGKCSAVLSSPGYRPLVPPGFKNSILERTPGSKSNHVLLEEGISTEEDALDSESSFQYGTTGLVRSANKKSEAQGHLTHASSDGPLEDPGILKLSPHILNEKAAFNSDSRPSSSLLETLFWGPAATDSHEVRSISENEGCKPHDARSAGSVQSSRFSQGLLEAEAKSADELSSGRPDDILSLIVSGGKSRYQVSGAETTEHSDAVFLNFEQPRKLLSTSSPADRVFNEQASVHSKEKSLPTVLTCEDLENSILTEYSAQSTSSLPPPNSWSAYQNVEVSKEHVDDNASLHLLSLLQRNSDQTKDEEISVANANLSETPDARSTISVATESKENDTSVVSSANSLTLEALFGSAFMKELQSAEAPVSIQGGLARSAEVQAPQPHGIPFPMDARISSAVNPANLQSPGNGQVLHPFNHLNSAENLPGYVDSKLEWTSVHPHAKDAPEYGRADGSTEFQVPVDSIMPSNGPHGYQMMARMSANSLNHERFSANALGHVGNMLGPETMAPKHGNLEPELHYRMQHLNMAQGRPLHEFPMESSRASRASQVEVLGPETFYNHGSLAANRHFPSNVHPFHDPNIRIPRSDVASHHPILHQMRIPGNYSSQMMADPPRAGSGFHQESASSLPFSPQQRVLGHLLPSTPGPGVIHRNRNPEIEVEKSAHFKQAHHFPPGHNQGIPWA